MLINIFKQAFAPAVASKALMHYWRGDYDKSYTLLAKASRWNPDVTKDSIFEAFLGLSLFHLGNHEAAMSHLISAQSFLTKVSSHNSEIASLESETLKQINQILSRRNVL
jgi:tetratricopeptide (TPR) repeat protein